MSNNRWDGTLNGVQFRLRRGDGAYNRFFSRQQVEEQFVLPTGGRTSREDKRVFFQSNWAGTSAWFRPRIEELSQDAYFYSRGLDTFSQPGVIRPLNATTTNDGTTDRGMEYDSGPMIVGPWGVDMRVIGISADEDGAFDNYIRYWNGSAWANSTQTFGMGTAQNMALAYSPADERHYVVSSSPEMGWINRQDSASGLITLGSANPSYGTGLVSGPLGQMHLYDGNILWRVDAAGTGLEEVTDDGFGFGAINYINTGTSGSPLHRYRLKLVTSSSEGIYYIKNTWNNGVPHPWMFRVERDAAGNVISIPIATLPVGTIAISLGFAYGAPIIVASYEWEKVLENASGGHYTTDVWSVFGGTLGLLGKIYARNPDSYATEAPTETVTQFLGAEDTMVLFGSTNGIWGYDNIRGGIHKLYEYAPAAESRTDHVWLKWPGQNKVLTNSVEIVKSRGTWDVPTSTLGTDDDTMTLYSGWIDFGLPGETKTLTKVKTKTDETGNAATNQWRVYIITEDGTETDISHSHVNVQEKETTGLSITSDKFMYRLIYETTSASAQPAALTEVFLTAESGEIVQGWQLTVDGTEFLNVENEEQDPEDVFDSWVTLGQTGAAISFEDNFESYDRDDKTSHSVTIQSVQIQKVAPGEAYIQVTLIDAS